MGRTHNQSKIRYIVAENYGWMCTYCYAHLDEDTASVDHIEPYAINHKTELDNLVLACKECNRLKADLSLLEFLLKKMNYNPN